MRDVLAGIVAEKRLEMARRPLRAPRDPAPPPSERDFAGALASGGLALIAEIKRRSPSAGPLRPGCDPARRARLYEEAGAAAISVLTDGPRFGGSPRDLADARAAVCVPILRKDFLVDPSQIDESRRIGADACLLIVAALDPLRLGEMKARAEALGMTPLLEVHDERELERALATGPRVVGINNRNLHDLSVDPATVHRLAPLVPDGIAVVSESGVQDPGDLARLPGRVDAVLIGTALMRLEDPRPFLREAGGIRKGGGG